MAAMKFTLVIFVVLTFIALGHAQSHNATFGSRGFGDVILDRRTIRKEPSMWGRVYDQYSYNQTKIGWPYTITQVRCLDQYRNDKGGYCQMLSGGPGLTSVRLSFVSRIMRGLHFVVEVYGRR